MSKHVKLVGGSLNTASHDREKIKTVKEAIKKMNDDQRDAHANRRNHDSMGSNDIEWD